MEISEAIRKVKTFDEAVSVGADLITYGSEANWLLGDLVNRIRIMGVNDPDIRKKIGTMRSFASAIRQSYSTVRDASRVARAVPQEVRNRYQGLTFGHFREIVKRGMSVEDIQRWAERADDDGWGVMRLRAELRSEKGRPERDGLKMIRGLTARAKDIQDDDISEVMINHPEDIIIALDTLRAVSQRIREAIDKQQPARQGHDGHVSI